MSGRDWLIAGALGLESIEPAFGTCRNRSFSNGLRLRRLAARGQLTVRQIFEGLCDTGLAMQDQGDSRPASGAEHHISHCLEMRGLSVDGSEALHGEKVAAETLGFRR